MFIVKTRYTESDAGARLIDGLGKIDLLESPVFLCIGSDHHILDCMGPLIGTMLISCAPGLPVFGTLENPVHARNLVKAVKEINKLHEGRAVVAIDASVGDEDEIGVIQIREGSLLPGRAYAKNLPAVGQYSITGVVDVRLSNPGRIGRRPGLGHVYQMAKILSESISCWYTGKYLIKP